MVIKQWPYQAVFLYQLEYFFAVKAPGHQQYLLNT